MRFKKDKWANGYHTVEITGYDCSRAGFLRVLTLICETHGTPTPEVASDLETHSAKLELGGKVVHFHMDKDAFSIAFPTEPERDAGLVVLQEKFR